MNTYLIKDVQIINEGNIVTGSVLIEHNRIIEIGRETGAKNKFALPSMQYSRIRYYRCD
jgi:dihydroorotase-like cyclic amidohydrolase